MKTIIISILLYLLLNVNLYADNNECKVKQYDNKAFFTCIKDFTQSNKSSFGILEGISGRVDLRVTIGDNIKYIQTYDNGYVNTCDINIGDKEKLLKDFDKWSNGNFSSNDLGYAKCIFKDESLEEKKLLLEIDINNLELIKENHLYKLYKGNNKGYILKISNLTIGDKKVEDFLCEITGSNGEGLKYIGDYIYDNIYIYEDKSYIDGTNGKTNCEINKMNLNIDLDIKTLKKLGGEYYQDKNGIYYFGKSYNNKGEYLNILKLDNVDIQTFKVTNDFFQESEDKNNIYIKGILDHKKIILIKKDNIIINDFKINNEKLKEIGSIFGKGYEGKFNYEFDIFTNVEGNFKYIVKTSINERESFSNNFKEGKAGFLKTFNKSDFKDIFTINISIYDVNGPKKSIFDEGKLIGTIQRKIKFTDNMENPEFVTDEEIKKKTNINEKIDVLLEKFDKKLINVGLKTKLNIYKKLDLKIKNITSKEDELIDILYKKVHSKYILLFKEYILSK